MVDIGGGSTEFIVGTTAVEAVRSLDIGCVRLTEKHLAHDPPAPEELSNAIAEATRATSTTSSARSRRSARPSTLVGVAGTVSTVAAVEVGLAE